MIRHLKLIMPLFLFLILSFSVMESAPATDDQPLIMAMEATGAKVEEFSINAWVKLPNGNLNDDQLESIVKDVISQLGKNPQDYQLIHQQKNQHKIVRAEIVDQNFHVMVIAQALPGEIGTGEWEGYLVVNFEDKAEENFFISHMQERIASIVNKFGSSPHISTCLIGWLGGKLMDGEQEKLLRDAFMVIDGKIIDKLEAEHYVSYTGFTPKITDWLAVTGKKINLNMAMRYSQYDNRTYITIGSPIITREY